MKRLRDVLLGTGKKPSGQGWPLPSTNPGDFVLTEALDVIHVAAGGTRYIRDPSVILKDAMFNIPGLTSEATNVVYLYLSAVRPVVGLTVDQFKTKTSFLAEPLEGAFGKGSLDPKDFFWHVPTGGVELATNKLLIPGFGKYYVDKTTWSVKHVSNDSLVIPGTNRGNLIVLSDDFNELAEVDTANIIRYANGDALHSDFDSKVYFIDFNTSNLNPANLTVTPPVVSDATVAISDITSDFVIQHGDGQ